MYKGSPWGRRGQAKVGQPCLQTWQSCCFLAGVNAVQVMEILTCYAVPCFLHHSHLSSCAVVVLSIPCFASACCSNLSRDVETLSWEQTLSEMPGSHHTGAGYSTWFGRLSGAAFSCRNTDGWGRSIDDEKTHQLPAVFQRFLKASWITLGALKSKGCGTKTEHVVFQGDFWLFLCS